MTPEDVVDPAEEAYKRAGLEASNAELAAKPQGFFESFRRLGEGNIDQPGSEAYNKYGAGRGRALEAAKAQARPAAVTPSQMPAYPGRMADRRADIQSEYAPSETALMKRQALSQPSMGEDKRSDMDDFQRAPARTKQASSGLPMVTKEALAASGLSLRDYLNKQQGLTRRGGGAPQQVGRMPARPGQESAAYSNEGRGSVAPQRPRGQGTVMEQGQNADIYGGAINDLAGLLKRNPKTKSFFDANDERIARLKKGGTVKKMASGGSASRRGDGIAIRGKTKGKIY
jgi:hypothetical protein